MKTIILALTLIAQGVSADYQQYNPYPNNPRPNYDWLIYQNQLRQIEQQQQMLREQQRQERNYEQERQIRMLQDSFGKGWN